MMIGVTPVGAQQLIGDLFVSCSCRNIVYAKLKPRQCSGFAWMGYLGGLQGGLQGQMPCAKIKDGAYYCYCA